MERAHGARDPRILGDRTTPIDPAYHSAAMTRSEFEALVREAIMEVPEPFASALDDVAVVVQERTPRGERDLYGLFVGAALDEPEARFGTLPPKIEVYMHPMVDHFTHAAELVEEIRITVLHELGHYLGISERRLDELGYA
jgi:predicted Zn-dependent protease with MMP-like domain